MQPNQIRYIKNNSFMKKLFLLLCTTGFILTSCTSNPEGTKAEVADVTQVAEASGNDLKVDTTLSTVQWTGKKISTSHHGLIQIKSGQIHVQNGQITAGDFVLDMNTLINLDLPKDKAPKIEGHLKSEDFFHVEKYPEAKLEITSVDGTGIGIHKVSANLTIKDITKNITFDADVKNITDTTFEASADFNIKRADWGVTYPGMPDDLISDEINYKVNLVAKK